MPLLKEGLLNFASVVTLLSPIIFCLFPEFIKEIVIVWAVVSSIALLAPPSGWMRPTRFSEVPRNRIGSGSY
jgi:hypothetical protein